MLHGRIKLLPGDVKIPALGLGCLSVAVGPVEHIGNFPFWYTPPRCLVGPQCARTRTKDRVS